MLKNDRWIIEQAEKGVNQVLTQFVPNTATVFLDY